MVPGDATKGIEFRTESIVLELGSGPIGEVLPPALLGEDAGDELLLPFSPLETYPLVRSPEASIIALMSMVTKIKVR